MPFLLFLLRLFLLFGTVHFVSGFLSRGAMNGFPRKVVLLVRRRFEFCRQFRDAFIKPLLVHLIPLAPALPCMAQNPVVLVRQIVSLDNEDVISAFKAKAKWRPKE
jgi:hypothetical protein